MAIDSSLVGLAIGAGVAAEHDHDIPGAGDGDMGQQRRRSYQQRRRQAAAAINVLAFAHGPPQFIVRRTGPHKRQNRNKGKGDYPPCGRLFRHKPHRFQAGAYNLFATGTRLPRGGPDEQYESTLDDPGTVFPVSAMYKF